MGSRISVAAVVLAVALAACGKSGGDETAAAPEPVAQLTPAEKAAVLASLPAPYNTADLKNGEMKFTLCKSCHTIEAGGPNMTGPNLYGVFGRKAGMGKDYSYSDAVKAAGFVWDAEHLDQWLANPRTFMPGTKMTFAGLPAPKDRIDLIAYLKVESGYKPQ
jgi:cytochrome c